jgi:hypothetical protein
METKQKWLATRVLHDASNPDVEVEVQIGFPEPWEGGLWRCAFRVEGLTAGEPDYGIGADALSAINGAQDGIAKQFRESGRRFSWGPLKGETGIRPQLPIFINAEFADEIEALIEKKIEAFVRRKAKKAERIIAAAKKPPPKGTKKK